MTTHWHSTRPFLPVILALAALVFLLSKAGATDLRVLNRQGKKATPTRAIENVCAWPNLTQTKDGHISAAIFNKPSHGGVANGAIDCYQWQDESKTWTKVGVIAAPSPSDPPSLRQHCAMGQASNGDLVALTTGFFVGKYENVVTPAWISRSSDGGKTWEVDRTGSGIDAVPYGDIELAHNGDLLAACYYNFNEVAVYRSADHGQTWQHAKRTPLGRGPGAGNETDILHLGKGEWIAVARDEQRNKAWQDPLKLYRSNNDGRSWSYQGHVTQAYQHPGELTLLRNGDILLTYGDRRGGAGGSSGVEVKISKDQGRSWSLPRRIADFPGFDGGYPSSVELSDGDILTVYYSTSGGYHMGHNLWNLPRTFQKHLSTQVREIGSRLELFVDRYLIDRMNNMQLKLHTPRLAPPMAQPADDLEYGTVIKDANVYRLYTREGRGAKYDGHSNEVTRYSESRDGIHWRKPNLGLYEIDGSKANNVILHEPWVCHNFSPFLDKRPGVPTGERFKALAGVHKGGGLVAFRSADGIHWFRLQEKPVITSKEFAFDSQNVSFWSKVEQEYVCYYRTWKTPHGQLRTISRTTSRDFITWTKPVAMHPNQPGEHLYTSQTHPYFRAPHIYLALPTRFQPHRGASTDILFMAARGAGQYHRPFREAFIRPGLDPDRWGNRSNYAALNVVPTGPDEMSIYTTPFRRFTLRTDGFVSVRAGADPGELVTLPLRFKGESLTINYSTSAGGSIRVEVQDTQGSPMTEFTAADCEEIVGDKTEYTVQWKDKPDLSKLAARPIRLRFLMREADLFSLRFSKRE